MRSSLGAAPPWAFGHVPQLAAWIIVILQLYDGVKCISCVPWFVFVILWVELVLFFLLRRRHPRLPVPASKAVLPRGAALPGPLPRLQGPARGLSLIANVLMRSRYEDAY